MQKIGGVFMQEQVANEIIMDLRGKIPFEELAIVKQSILSTLVNYEVTSKETALALYEALIPKYYEIYLVTMKINGRSPDTLKTYNFHLLDFFFNLHRPLKDITSADIYAYLYSVQQRGTVSNRTLDHIRVIINGFLSWCYGEGYLPNNPCKGVKPIKFTVKERQPLTDIELELVREACITERESAIIETMYSTGCRVSELARLNREDVDLKDRSVVLFGKGSKYRTSFLNAKAELKIRKYLKTRSDCCPSLIVSEIKPVRGLKTGTIETIVKDIGERAGLGRNLTPHILRHTFATNLIKRGASLEDVQKLLGHEKPSTTLIYTKINTEAIRRDHERYIL